MDEEQWERLVSAIEGLRTWMKYLGNGDASTTFGAIEAHGMAIKEAAEEIASGLRDVAGAIRESSSNETQGNR
jgi:hypothetical protein